MGWRSVAVGQVVGFDLSSGPTNVHIDDGRKGNGGLFTMTVQGSGGLTYSGQPLTRTADGRWQTGVKSEKDRNFDHKLAGSGSGVVQVSLTETNPRRTDIGKVQFLGAPVSGKLASVCDVHAFDAVGEASLYKDGRFAGSFALVDGAGNPPQALASSPASAPRAGLNFAAKRCPQRIETPLADLCTQFPQAALCAK